MERFLHLQNLAHFKELLLRVTDERQRKQIEDLIAEEEAKAPSPKLDAPCDKETALPEEGRCRGH